MVLLCGTRSRDGNDPMLLLFRLEQAVFGVVACLTTEHTKDQKRLAGLAKRKVHQVLEQCLGDVMLADILQVTAID